MILPRRHFLAGLGASLLGAPAIVRASSLMALPVRRRLDLATPALIDLLVRSDAHLRHLADPPALRAAIQDALWFGGGVMIEGGNPPTFRSIPIRLAS